MQLKPETTLQSGKYRIIKTLGQGGFGITYLAEQVALGRKVAVKEFFMRDCCERQGNTSFILVPTQSNRALVEKFRGKFIREAKMMALFDHLHIVRVTDVFEENGTAYYVMDYLSGGSLADKVKWEGSLSEEQAETYVRQVADALAFIHSQNTVHLDVKPSNILLNAKNEAVLIDFGTSKHYDKAGEQTSSTPVGISKGYAPLEQSRDGDVSQFKPSTDIYALGATLYYLSTGKVPPEASIVNEEGLERPQGISSRIWHAIEQAMQPRRKDRPQSVTEFLALLDAKASPAPNPIVVKSTPPVSEVTEITLKNKVSLKQKVVQKPKVSPKESPMSSEQKKTKTWLRALIAFAAVTAVIVAIIWSGRKDKPVPDGLLATVDTTMTASVADSTVSASHSSPQTHTKPETEPEPIITGSVVITSSPPGATIWLDGKNTKKSTPDLLSDLVPGKHSVKMELDGYDAFIGTITVTAGKCDNFSQILKVKETRALDEPPVLAQNANPEDNPVPVADSTVTVGTTPAPKPSTGSINGHEWVDLGLSVKWATCNVGASSPSDYGSYIAWGETSPKDKYLWSNLRYCSDETGDSFTKYNTDLQKGPIDTKEQLDLTDDAARANWGAGWRMPTDAEMRELIVHCKWKWMKQGGKNGYKVTSVTTGNSIFLPAAGFKRSSKIVDEGSFGYYWSSSLDWYKPNCAWYLYFSSSEVGTYSDSRYFGPAIRPVTR